MVELRLRAALRLHHRRNHLYRVVELHDLGDAILKRIFKFLELCAFMAFFAVALVVAISYRVLTDLGWRRG